MKFIIHYPDRVTVFEKVWDSDEMKEWHYEPRCFDGPQYIEVEIDEVFLTAKAPEDATGGTTLADMIREEKAKAWEGGYSSGVMSAGFPYWTKPPNPYLAPEKGIVSPAPLSENQKEETK